MADFHIVNKHLVMTRLLAVTLKMCSEFLEKTDIGMDYSQTFGCCCSQRSPPMEVVDKQKNIEHNPEEIVLASEVASAGIVFVAEAWTVSFAGTVIVVEPMAQHNC